MDRYTLTRGTGASAEATSQNTVDGVIRIQAVEGQTIRLIRAEDDATGEVSLWRKKKDLLIKVDDEVQAIIEDFYAIDGEGGLAVEGDLMLAYDQIDADAAAESSESLVWWGEANVVDMAPAAPMAVASTTETIPESTPAPVSSVAEASSPAPTSTVAEPASEAVSALPPTAAAAPVAESAAQNDDSDEGGWVSDNAWLIAGGALLLAGAAYLLTRDDDEDNSASLQLSAFAGPFFSDAIVNVYDANGNLIGTGTLDSVTGQVNVNLGDYRGLAVVEVVDANDTDADYTSEATGQGTDLDTSLRAMVDVTGKGTFSVSVTPLTELAVRAAGLPDDLTELVDSPLTAEQLALNEQIAALFGLDDILDAVITVLDAEYDSADGISAAELYGDILAILSGAESNIGGLNDLIDQLLAEITITDGVATLSAAGGLLLQQGQDQYEKEGTGNALTGQTVIEDMPKASDFPDIVTTNELNTDQSLSMDINAVSVGDSVTIMLGDETHSVIITAEMMNEGGVSATIDFPSSKLFQLEDGVQTLQLTVNDVARQETLLTLDITRPYVQSVELDSDLLVVGDTATLTITFSEAVTDFSAANVTLEHGSITALSSSDGVTWTAIYTPGEDVEDASLAITIGTGYTDLNGNLAELTFNNDNTGVQTDTLAPATPDAFLESDKGFSDTDGVTKWGTIIFGTATEDDLTYKYSLDGGDSWTETELNYVNLPEGTYEQGDILVVAIDVNGNESEAYVHPIELVIDNSSPSLLTIELADSALKANETTTVTFTFSEAISEFDISLINVEGGELSALASDDGIIWTATFTPSEDLEDATNVISVAGDNSEFEDIAGNSADGGASSDNYAVDTVLPTANFLMLSDSDLIAGESVQVSVVFSEYMDESSITLEDFSVEHGTLSNLLVDSGEGTTMAYFTFTPDEDVEDVTSVITLATSVTDLAGNSLQQEASSGSIAIDTLAPDSPVVTLVDDTNSPTDLITSDGTLSVTGIEQNATVEYSTDGTNWTDSFVAVEGANTVYVRQTDTSGNVSEASSLTFTLDTTAPAINSLAPALFDEGQAVETVVYTATSDEANVIFSLSGTDAEYFNIDASTGAVTLKESADYESNKISYDFTVYATDAAGNVSDGQDVTLNIGDVDDTAPTLTQAPISFSITDNSATAGATIAFFGVSDVEGGTVTLSIEGDHADYYYVSGNAIYLSQLGADAVNSQLHDDLADYSFNVIATDEADNASDPVTVNPTINYVNDAPIAYNDSNDAVEDGAVISGQVQGYDEEDGIASYHLDTDVSEGSLTFNSDGSYSFDPGSDFQDLADGQSRDVTFTYYVVDDENVQSSRATVTITVAGANDAPVVTNISDDVTVGSTITDGSVAGTDADDGIQSYTLVTNVEEGTLVFNTSTGAFTFDPGSDFDDLAENATRDVTFTYYATDVAGASSETKTVTITVTGAVLDTTPPEVTINVFESGILYDADVDSTPFTVSSTETGVVYLFEESTVVTSVTDITSASDDLWNQVTITAADTDVDMDISGLAQGNYRAYAVDEAGNISAQSSYYVSIADMTAPDVTLTAFEGVTTVTEGDSTTLDVQSTETGTVYFVNTSVTVNSLSSITNAADDQWNSVTITAADTAVDLDTTGLAAGDYVAYAVDSSGNISDASDSITVTSATPTTVNVLFNFKTGVSTLDVDSDREFDANVTYNIYMLVDSDSEALTMASGSVWSGLANLGSDDTIYLVGDDASGDVIIQTWAGDYPPNSVSMVNSGNLTWLDTAFSFADIFTVQNGVATKYVDYVTSDTATWATGSFSASDYPNQGITSLNDVYYNSLPLQSTDFYWPES